MKQGYKRLLPIALLAVLLCGCGMRPSEGPPPADSQPTTRSTQPPARYDGLDEGELPAITIPQQTQPDPDPTEGTEHSATIKPTEGTEPPAVTEPAQETTPPEPTENTGPTSPPEASEPTEDSVPAETTVPTESTEPPKLDEDEMPPIPVG